MNQNDSREQRLQAALVDCIENGETGHGIDRAAMLRRYPEFAAELDDFFSGQAGIAPLAKRLRDLESAHVRADSAGEPTLAPSEGPATSLPPGTRVGYFGDYELLEEIGRGGMGVVYKARQVTLNRVAALKMILAGQLANEDEVRRFQAEAEAAARLDHPGIVAVYEVGRHETQHYFSMAFIEGESLARKLAQGLPPAKQAAELIRKVAEAVAYAHVEGVIHRDLKPANILIDKQGQPRLTDFGLAKRIQADPKADVSELTQTGQVLGTPSYMPPEQASGQRGAVGPLADVYSLGAILYCLLTGRPPFQADNPLDTLLQVLQREPIAPRQVNAAVPRDLDTICLKCLEKEPRKRYPSARDLVADLERYLEGKPIVARPTGTVERMLKWARRRPAAAALAAVSGLALVILTATWIAFTITLDDSRRRAEKGESDAIAQERLTAGALKDKANALARAEKGEADAITQQKLTTAALRRAEGLRLIAQSEVVRRDNPALAWLLGLEAAKRLPGLLANNALQAAMDECRERKVLLGHQGPVFAASFSGDNKKIVTCSEDGTARIWDVATGKTLHILSVKKLVQAHLSPDGKRVLTLSGDSAFRRTMSGLGSVATDYWEKSGPAVQLWDATTGQPIARWQPPPKLGQPSQHFVFAAGASFSADSRRVVTFFGFHPEGHPQVHDAVTGKQVAVLKGHCPVIAVAFSPDNRTIATGGTDDTVCLWDAESGKRLHVLKGHQCNLGAVIFNSDGKLLLTLGSGLKHNASGGSQGYTFVADDAAGRVWDTEKGRLRCALKWPDFNRDHYLNGVMAHGSVLLAGSQGVPRLWNLSNGAPVPLRSGQAPEMPRQGIRTAVQISNQGRLVVFAGQDRTAQILALGTTLVTLRGHDGVVHSAACSVDEKHIVTASEDGTARLWAAPVLGVPEQSGPDCWGTSRSALSADGRRLFLNAFAALQGIVVDPVTGREVFRTRLKMPEAHFSRDGKRALVLGIEKGDSYDSLSPLAAELVDTESGKSLACMPTLPGGFLALSPDCRQMVVAVLDRKKSNYQDGSAEVWDLYAGKKLADLKGHTWAIQEASFSSDGRRILTLSQGQPGRIWDAATGKEIGHFTGYNSWPEAAAFLADGKELVAIQVSSWEVAKVVSAESGKVLRSFTANKLRDITPFNPLKILSVHPDGRRFLIMPFRDLPCIYDTMREGQPTVKLKGHAEAVTYCRFTADGRRVLTASDDRTARLWDADTGKQLQVFKGHDEAVKLAALDPAGGRLVTFSSDQTARLWDARTGEEMARLRWPHGVEELAFADDGRRVILRGVPAVRLWSIDVLATARARQPRELTPAERTRFEVPSQATD